ncbi:MAG: hypothetical protein FWE84_03980 [Firmicutes bacterium]|nr:hypothetical protein [Bacillota bacterium]
MLCERCGKNEATGIYEDAKNGVKAVTRLCTGCLLDKQKELFGGLNMFAADAPLKKSRCNKCGADINSVVKTLFLGCPDCYEAFEQYLPQVIKKIQNATAHVGSSPGAGLPNGQYAASKSEIDALKAQLAAAINEDRFEDAEIISKRLKAIRGDTQ